MLSSLKLGFVGAGNMARAIGFPLIQKGIINPKNIIASSPEESYLQPWKEHGTNITFDNGEVIDSSDTIIWAVKPQVFSSAIKATLPKKSPIDHKFHVSIMAGVTLDTFSQAVKTSIHPNENFTSARVMPNIALSVSSGCSVFTMGKVQSDSETKQKESRETLKQILGSNGLTYEVKEDAINAYCGLFGSGIGFMFLVLEAMSDGGVCMGIQRDKSLEFAAMTMKGAAELILNGAGHPASLKDSVCSPGGTTIAGVAELEKYGVRNGIINAIIAATRRGEELGGK